MRNANTVDSEASFHMEKTSFIFERLLLDFFFYGADFIIKGFGVLSSYATWNKRKTYFSGGVNNVV